MDWNCTLTEERLSDALEGTLLPDEAAAFSKHAAACERCAGLVAQVGGLVTRMRQIPPVDEPPFLASRIIAATRGTPARRPGAGGWFAWLPAIWQPRFAMGVLTVAATFLIVFHAVSAAPGKIGFSPANLFRNANRHAHLTYARGVKFVNDLRVVYVIQSRLSSQPQPIPEPATAPFPEPESTPQQRPPDSEARPKSRPIPHTGRHGTPDSGELAILIVTDGIQNPLYETSRSLP
jgi:hypothetical protein